MATIDMSLKPAFPARTIYDTVGAIQGADANTSLVANAPFAIQLDTVPAGTTVVIEKRLSPDAGWILDTTVVGAGVGALVAFPVRLNFVRVRRTVGTGAVKAFSQGA